MPDRSRLRLPTPKAVRITLVGILFCLVSCSDDPGTTDPVPDAGDGIDMRVEDNNVTDGGNDSDGGSEVEDMGSTSDAAGDAGADAAMADAGADTGVCDRPCGQDCCEGDEFCNFGSCVTPGDFCQRDEDCTVDTDYCELTPGVDAGSPPDDGLTCPPLGELPWGNCVPRPTNLGSCTHKSAGDPTAIVEYSWGDVNATNDDVIMTPVIVQLDDDDCDGDVDEHDIPEIAFLTFEGNDYNNNSGASARLVAISAVDGAITEKFARDLTSDEPTANIAAGNIDGVPGNEIVVCSEDSRVRAYDSTGTPLWTSPVLGAPCRTVVIADLDQNGDVEVIASDAALDGATGNVDVSFPAALTDLAVTDIDDDGDLDVVGPGAVYDATGTLIADSGLTGSSVAVAQLDGVGAPEIISVAAASHTLTIWRVESLGAVVVRSVDLFGLSLNNTCCQINPNSAGCTRGGGAPVIADFTGDGVPDVGLSSGFAYQVYNGADLMDSTVADVDTMEWVTQVQDCSSAQTGSSAFDIDNDGTYEVLFADETTFRILDGASGTELFTTCNTSGTIREMPVVADVDADGFAEIVVPSNRYSALSCSGQTKTTGIRVFGAENGHWARALRVWNQAPFHVTNAEPDGTILSSPDLHWKDPATNIYRATTLGEASDAAPDLVAELSVECDPDLTIVARVRNLGEATAPEGIVVGFYDGDPDNGGSLIDSVTTERPLGVLGSTNLELEPDSAPTGELFVVVDDTQAVHAWQECRTDNNNAGPVDATCPSL